MQLNAAGRLESMTVTQQDPMKRGLIWPQRLRVTVGFDGSVKELPVYVTEATTSVKGAKGLPAPNYVLPAGGGLGYGLFILDEGSRDYLLRHVDEVKDPLTRGAAWVTLWDNLQASRVNPLQLLDTALRALPREDDEQNAQRVLSYVTRVFWRFMPAAERAARAPALEAALRAGVDRGGHPQPPTLGLMTQLVQHRHAKPLPRDANPVMAQVGWLGASGTVYALGDSPSDGRERGSYSPIYIQIGTWEDLGDGRRGIKD